MKAMLPKNSTKLSVSWNAVSLTRVRSVSESPEVRAISSPLDRRSKKDRSWYMMC